MRRLKLRSLFEYWSDVDAQQYRGCSMTRLQFFCHMCGPVQQLQLPAPELRYVEPRHGGGGLTWEMHYRHLAGVVAGPTSGSARIAEIGSGNGGLRLVGAHFVSTVVLLGGVDPHKLAGILDPLKTGKYFDGTDPRVTRLGVQGLSPSTVCFKRGEAVKWAT